MRSAVPAVVLALLAVGCGGEDPAPVSLPDELDLVVNGGEGTLSEANEGVTVTALGAVDGGLDIYAAGAVTTGDVRMGPISARIRLDPPLPETFPATVPGSLTYTTPYWTVTNGQVSYAITRLDAGGPGIVEGSFATTTLGPGRVDVSGSFRSTRGD